jgi:hypothetical protein
MEMVMYLQTRPPSAVVAKVVSFNNINIAFRAREYLPSEIDRAKGSGHALINRWLERSCCMLCIHVLGMGDRSASSECTQSSMGYLYVQYILSLDFQKKRNALLPPSEQRKLQHLLCHNHTMYRHVVTPTKCRVKGAFEFYEFCERNNLTSSSSRQKPG